MRPVLADTSYYLALFNENDPHHKAALQFSRAAALTVVVTDFVLLEIGNAYSRRSMRGTFCTLVADVRSDPWCQLVPVSKALFEAGLLLYARRPDKDWSLTDCISFVVMKRLRLTEALTADRHFEQAGFKVLLKP
ncbi:MAG: PIN domain-containing protein [Planctomycetota bacterium]|nr:PIN domain-containing protein [Planctomycetota bacterium]